MKPSYYIQVTHQGDDDSDEDDNDDHADDDDADADENDVANSDVGDNAGDDDGVVDAEDNLEVVDNVNDITSAGEILENLFLFVNGVWIQNQSFALRFWVAVIAYRWKKIKSCQNIEDIMKIPRTTVK